MTKTMENMQELFDFIKSVPMADIKFEDLKIGKLITISRDNEYKGETNIYIDFTDCGSVPVYVDVFTHDANGDIIFEDYYMLYGGQWMYA